jgi:hypothetical protein
MPDEPLLREKAREAIRSGRLPSTRASRIFGGPGSGAPCAVCREPIPRTDTEYELEFNRHGTKPGFDRYYLHYRCFAAWELERAKVDDQT